MLVVASLAGAATAAPGAVEVTNVTLGASQKGKAEVVVKTTQKPTFSARVTDGGNRLLLDIQGAVVKGAPAALVEGNDVVAGVMTQAFQSPAATRVLITLAHPASYSVQSTSEGLVIRLEKAEKTSAAKAPIEIAPAGTSDAAPVELATLKDVRFSHGADRDKIFLELGGDAKVTQSEKKGIERIELSGVKVPTALVRTLDVAAFHGLVDTISTFKKGGSDDTAVIEIAHHGGARALVSREGQTVVVSMMTGAPTASETGVAADGGAARRTRTISREELPDLPKVETGFGDNPLERSVEPEQADAFLPGMAGQVAPGDDKNRDQGNRAAAVGGRRIDLDLKDADIHDVLRLLADVGKVNVVTADNVTGSVTIRMRSVPWDQALDTVLQAKGLGMVRKGNLIRVAPIADLNKERELALARRKSEFELAPLETRLIPISYAGATDMQDRAKELLSPRGSIAVDGRTNVLIARDITGNLNQIEELIRALDTQTPQVLIEARIVEANSTFTREIGIQWGGDATFSQATGNDTGIAFPNSIGIAGGASPDASNTAGLNPNASQLQNPNFAVNLPAAVGSGSGGALGFTFGSIDQNFNLNVRLSALEANGMGRIISSPRVLTLDNRTARISSGTLIPFSQVGAQGVQTVFQEAKLQLLVTPHVTSDASVALKVKVNRDEPDFSRLSARGDPTILKREVETELLLQDGHTAVIGGIYTRNSTRNVSQVPLLGDIPILGVLFQKRSSQDNRTELVVFVTPRIVNRAESLGR
jgi:type IV pilus assembly protein PilQ